MDRRHEISDEQSLRLVQAAITALRREPHRVAEALATLDHWERVASPASAPLRALWRDILLSGDHTRALARDDLGQQLRQAAPLTRLIDPALRLQVIRACKGRLST